MSIKFYIFKNQFDPHERIFKEIDYIPGSTIVEYLPELNNIDCDFFNVSKNGRVIGSNLSEIIPYENDIITITAKAKAAAITTALVGFTWAEATTASAMFLYGAVYATTYIGLSIGTAYLVNKTAMSMYGPDKPSSHMSNPTYGWDALSSTIGQGYPIPILYGTQKVSGQIINQFITLQSNSYQYLNILLGLCEGPVDSITNIQINGQDISFYDDVETVTALGTPNDEPFTGFDKTNIQINVGSTVLWGPHPGDEGEIEQTIPGSTTTEINIFLTSNGLYYQNNDGSVSSMPVYYDIYYNKKVGGVWDDNNWVLAEFSDQITGTITGIGDGPSGSGLVYLQFDGQDPPFTDQLPQENIYNNVVPLYSGMVWNTTAGKTEVIDWVYYATANRLYIPLGSYTYTMFEIGDTIRIPSHIGRIGILQGEFGAVNQERTISGLDAGEYKIRVNRCTWPFNGNSRGQNEITLAKASSLVNKSLIYPGIAKLGVKFLATNQLSGSTPTITCEVTRSTINVYDTSLETPAWVEKNATNPAWACYDILHTYGNISVDHIIFADFAIWADYCDELIPDDGNEKRHVFNKYIDVQKSVMELVQEVAGYGRGVIISKGTKYSVFIDKAETTISHLFTEGNIIAGSASIQYLPQKEKANAIEVRYIDPDKDYTSQSLSIFSSDYYASTSTAHKTNLSIEAAMTRTKIIRDAQFQLNYNNLIKRTISFKASVDSFPCIIGDLFNFQNKFTNYSGGVSGRILNAYNSGGSGYVQLDTEATIDATSIYKIKVRLSDDSLVEKTIATIGTVTTDTLELVTEWSVVPDKFDVFAMGEASNYISTYRLISISNYDDTTKELVGIEYDADIYDDSGVISSDTTYSEIQYQVAIQVKATEYLVFSKGGSYSPAINVSWFPTYVSSVTRWAIWLEDITAGTEPVKVKDVDTLYANGISDLITGNTYTIYVTPINKGPVDTGDNTFSITIQGQQAPPETVSWDTTPLTPGYKTMAVKWVPNPEIDIFGYNLQRDISTLFTGESFNEFNGIQQNHYLDSSLEDHTRYYYRVKAVDQTGNISTDWSTTQSAETLNLFSLTPSGEATPTAHGLNWDGTTLNISGEINALAGQIAGWEISGEVLSAGQIEIDATPGFEQITNGNVTLDNTGITINNGEINLNNGTFLVDNGGNLTATSATISGKVTATTGAIGGWDITPDALTKGTDVILDASLRKISINSASFGSAGIQLDYNDGTPRAYIGDASSNYFKFDGTNISWSGKNISHTTGGVFTATDAVITGNVTANTLIATNAGTIANFEISSSSLHTGAFDTNGTLYFGTSGLSLSDTFKVTAAGALTATSAIISGTITAEDGAIGGWSLAETSITGTGVTLSSSGDAYISFGTTPPTAPTIGTGIFINKTGLFGLNADTQRFKVLEDGSGFLGASDILSWTNTGVVTAAGFTLANNALYTGTKTAYNDTVAGVHIGNDGIGIGNNIFTVSSAGVITAKSGTIGGWSLGTQILRSTASGAGIELDQAKSRISVKDGSDASKVVMGYLNGLAKNDGSGDWGPNDYGFWAAQGDNLRIDGDTTYKSGDWIVEEDGSYLINNASGETVVRLGSDTGERGLFFYDGTDQLIKLEGTGLTVNDGGDINLEQGGTVNLLSTYFNAPGIKFTDSLTSPTFSTILGQSGLGQFTLRTEGADRTTISNYTDISNYAELQLFKVPYNGFSLIAANTGAYVQLFGSTQSGYEHLLLYDSATNGQIYMGYNGISFRPGVANAIEVGIGFKAVSGNSLVLTDNTGNGLTILDGGNVSQTAGKYISTDEVRALSASGLALTDSTSQGPLVNDGGAVTNAYQPSVKATLSADYTIPVGVSFTVPLDQTSWDIAGEFNTTTYTLTAAETGLYRISGLLECNALDTDAIANFFQLVTIDATIDLGMIDPSKFSWNLVYFPFILSAEFKMTAGDTAYIRGFQINGASQAKIFHTFSYVNFQLVG